MQVFEIAPPDPDLFAIRRDDDLAIDLIIDLAGLDPAGLGAAARRVENGSGRPLSVRVSGLAEPRIEMELAAVMPARPPLVFVEAVHGRDVADLGGRLAAHEAEAGLPDGATGIVAVIGTAFGVLNAASFVGASPRLAGLAWDADALAGELGVPRTMADGRWSALLAQGRTLVRLAAAAAGVDAIDAEGAPGEARDGFSAMLRRPRSQSATARR